MLRIKQLAAFLVPVIALTSCGGGDEVVEETKVHTKQESTTLANKGTAATEAEAKKREEETARKLRENEAKKKLMQFEIQLSNAEKSGDGFDIAEAIEKIAELGDQAAPFEPRLEEYLNHEDTDVRIAALKTLVAVRHEKARPTLQKAFEDDEDAVRVAALRQWRKAGIRETAPVIALLDDFDSDVQYEAVAALQAAKPDVTVLETITKKVNDFEGPTARLALAIGLENRERLGDAAVDALIVKLMDHQDARTRIDALDQAQANKLLRRVVADQMASILRNDPDDKVRGRAYEILKSWAGAGAPPYDPDADDAARRAAAEVWRAWVEANAAKFGA